MTSRISSGLVALAAGLAAQPLSAEEPQRKLDLGAFVDGYYSYNTNRPADHANFFPGAGTSAKRDNELAINLAEVDLTLDPAPVGFRVAFGFGNSVEVVHGAETTGAATSPDVWRNVVQASIQYRRKVGRGLDVEAGIYPSHIGFEVLQSKDNWNYTRSWLGEFSPYYQTGIKLSYPLGKRWSGQLHLLNGWQVIADNNRGKTVGWQVAYSADKLSFSVNGLVGPELADNDEDLRALLDTVAQWHITPAFTLAGSVDVGSEERPVGDNMGWYGVGFYARCAPPEEHWAVALRTEYYDDGDGAILGTPQILREATLTFEHRPVEQLILKLEGRYDRSSAHVFTGELDAAGAPIGEREQFLVLAGAVAQF